MRSMANPVPQPSPDILLGKKPPISAQDSPRSIALQLLINDPDCVSELLVREEGRDRDDYALAAVRIGLLSMKHARGQVDADAVKREGDKLLRELSSAIESYRKQINDNVNSTLKEYFDPKDGRFQERLDRLLQKDGDLERLLQRHIGVDDSELARTMASHIGEKSSLMKLLNPAESKSLVQVLGTSVREILQQETKTVLAEFSLDNRNSALSRLISEISQESGKLKGDLANQVGEVVQEFSLDKEDSALSRLVRKVEQAQKTISKEFSLDDENSALSHISGLLQEATAAINTNLTLDEEGSALARLRRELLDILARHENQANTFQKDVTVALEAMKARREESLRSTTHGKDFEDVAVEFIQREAQRLNDVPRATGAKTGNIKYRKVGDAVVELGPECAAAGEKFVVEAKEDSSYDLSRARTEIETARKNRDASVGIFIFSKKTAPGGQEPLLRHGSDIFVVWDAEDINSDVILKAGISLARALCIRHNAVRKAEASDFKSLDSAILAVEKESMRLAEIKTWSETIRASNNKILEEVRKMQENLEKQIDQLRDGVTGLKESVKEE